MLHAAPDVETERLLAETLPGGRRSSTCTGGKHGLDHSDQEVIPKLAALQRRWGCVFVFPLYSSLHHPSSVWEQRQASPASEELQQNPLEETPTPVI